MDINHRGVLTWIYDADLAVWVPGGNRSVLRRSQIMRLCYFTLFLLISLHKTPYFTKILDRIGDVAVFIIVDESCAIRETLVPRDVASLRQALGNYLNKYSLPLIFTFHLNGDTSVPELFPVFNAAVACEKVFTVLLLKASFGIVIACFCVCVSVCVSVCASITCLPAR